MLKKDFWYDLPKELIAQEPADPRDSARLMVLSQKDDSIQHKIFHDLPEFLEPGDLLVVNNSKVLPARIVGVKQPTGAVCELLLLRQVKGDQWECLAKPGKRMQPGTKVSFGDGSLTAVVDETMEDGKAYKGKAEGSNSSEGLWIANLTGKPLKETTNILWFESAYDAMAEYQINPVKSVYVSTRSDVRHQQAWRHTIFQR